MNECFNFSGRIWRYLFSVNYDIQEENELTKSDGGNFGGCLIWCIS